MKVILYSDDLELLCMWKEKINIYECEIIENLNTLDLYKNAVLLLDYSSCYKILPKCIIISKKLNIKLLLLDNIPTFEKGKNVLNLGVQGYGNRLLSSIYINSAIETLQNNMVWVYPEFTTSLIQGFTKEQVIPDDIKRNLTSREIDTALLIKDGLTNNEISEHLKISINTVKSHVKNIYEKLNVKNRLSLSLLFKSKY